MGVDHPEWIEDSILEELIQRLTGGYFDNCTQDIGGIPIDQSRPRLNGKGQARKLPGGFLDRLVTTC